MLKKLLYGYMLDLMHLLAVHVAVTPKLRGVHILLATYFIEYIGLWSNTSVMHHKALIYNLHERK